MKNNNNSNKNKKSDGTVAKELNLINPKRCIFFLYEDVEKEKKPKR
jgi:hypothetical protein